MKYVASAMVVCAIVIIMVLFYKDSTINSARVEGSNYTFGDDVIPDKILPKIKTTDKGWFINGKPVKSVKIGRFEIRINFKDGTTKTFNEFEIDSD